MLLVLVYTGCYSYWLIRKCCWSVEAHLTILVLDVMVMKLRNFRKDIDIFDEELYDSCLHDDIVSMEVCLLSDSLMDSKLEHSPSLSLPLYLSFYLLFSSPPFFTFLLSSSPLLLPNLLSFPFYPFPILFPFPSYPFPMRFEPMTSWS